MSNPVQPVHPVTAQAETKPATPAPKAPQARAQAAAPQDTVTISASAKHALAGNSKPGD